MNEEKKSLLSWSTLFGGGRFSERSWKGDLFGGVTTAIISLPLALAFGVASGAGPQAGLTGAVLVGLFSAIFGGSRTLISEPTGPMTVVMTAVITTLVAQDPENGLAMAFCVILVAGLTQVLLGALKLGRYITLMPYSVISGFMSGIGILLILMQIYPLFGSTTPQGGVLAAVQGIPELIRTLSWGEASLGVLSLVILFAMPAKWKTYCPPHLLALLIGTVVAALFFADGAVKEIGQIPMGLPEFSVPHFSLGQMKVILLEGLILGLLGSIDTLLTAMIADSLTRQNHDSDRELIGQGIANMVTSFFGGLPGAGATMGTVTNIQVGAKTPWAAIFRATLLLITILFLAPLLESIPLAVLAAIAVKVGMDILDWSFLTRAHAVSGTAAFIMYGVMGLTVFVDLVVAVGVGVFIANILTIEKLTQLQSNRVQTVDVTDDEIPLNSEEKKLFEKGEGKILLFHLSGPMIFGVAKAISAEQEALSRAKALVMDLTDVPILSTTVALALENVVKTAGASHVPVFICTGSEETKKRMERIKKTAQFELVIVESRLDALEEALKHCETKEA
ncbi:MAG: SulP family inorganic anion transporter [Verrucomicrobiota bacterium]